MAALSELPVGTVAESTTLQAPIVLVPAGKICYWFESNNMARLWDEKTDSGFLYTFLVGHLSRLWPFARGGGFPCQNADFRPLVRAPEWL